MGTNREVAAVRDREKKKLVLETVRSAGLPVGASYLSQQLGLPPATIGRILTTLEEERLVTKVSNKGRILTEQGEMFLRQQDLVREREETAEELAELAAKSDKDTLLEVLQVRRLLETYSAEQACLHATEAQIEHLETLMLAHLHEIRNGGLGNEVDLEIHLAIAEASGVQTIYQILKLILVKDDAYTKFSFVSDQLKNAHIKQHDAIIQAIRDRDPEQAKAAMDSHLRQIMGDVERYYEGDSSEA